MSGQTRLAFLLDLFEEDLARHRQNLNSLVSLQRRYNAEQFNEVMRLEAELGQITVNLLRLIESKYYIILLVYYYVPSISLRIICYELQELFAASVVINVKAVGENALIKIEDA